MAEKVSSSYTDKKLFEAEISKIDMTKSRNEITQAKKRVATTLGITLAAVNAHINRNAKRQKLKKESVFLQNKDKSNTERLLDLRMEVMHSKLLELPVHKQDAVLKAMESIVDLAKELTT